MWHRPVGVALVGVTCGSLSRLCLEPGVRFCAATTASKLSSAYQLVDSRLLSTAFNLQGEWVCPECAAGKAPPPRRAATARERFLQQQGLALARIEAIWQVRLCGCKQVAVHALLVCRMCMSLLASAEGLDSSSAAIAWLRYICCLTMQLARVPQEPGGDVECTFRWYGLPEDTHTGRQVRGGSYGRKFAREPAAAVADLLCNVQAGRQQAEPPEHPALQPAQPSPLSSTTTCLLRRCVAAAPPGT